LVAPDKIECKEALIWGSVLLARHLWEQVNLPEILKKRPGSILGNNWGTLI